MLYRLEIPTLLPDVREATLDRWHCAEGAEVDFGDPVCDLVVHQHYRRVRRQNPNRVARGEEAAQEIVTRKVDMRIVLISSDRGVIRRVEAEPGTEVRAGDRIGLASSEASDSVDGDPELSFRMLADLAPGAGSQSEGSMEAGW